MKPLWTIGRKISAVIAALLLAFGLKCLWDARQHSKRYHEWEVAKPVDVAIDLSKPGEFVVPFHQTCSISHGEMMALRVPPEVLKSITSGQPLGGLETRIELQELGSTNVMELERFETSWPQGEARGLIPIMLMRSFKNGDYELKIKVISGAPALEGIPQRLEVSYSLCGMEMWPAFIAGGIGIISLLAGAITAGIIWFLIRRARKSSNPDPAV